MNLAIIIQRAFARKVAAIVQTNKADRDSIAIPDVVFAISK